MTNRRHHQRKRKKRKPTLPVGKVRHHVATATYHAVRAKANGGMFRVAKGIDARKKDGAKTVVHAMENDHRDRRATANVVRKSARAMASVARNRHVVNVVRSLRATSCMSC